MTLRKDGELLAGDVVAAARQQERPGNACVDLDVLQLAIEAIELIVVVGHLLDGVPSVRDRFHAEVVAVLEHGEHVIEGVVEPRVTFGHDEAVRSGEVLSPATGSLANRDDRVGSLPPMFQCFARERVARGFHLRRPFSSWPFSHSDSPRTSMRSSTPIGVRIVLDARGPVEFRFVSPPDDQRNEKKEAVLSGVSEAYLLTLRTSLAAR